MESQCTLDRQRRENFCHFALTKDVKVAESIQSCWNKQNSASKNQSRQPVKKGPADTDDVREYYETYRRAVRSGNAVE